MAMANMNLIVVFVTKLWPVQALACGGGETKNVTPLIFFKFRVYNYLMEVSRILPSYKVYCNILGINNVMCTIMYKPEDIHQNNFPTREARRKLFW